MSSAADKVEAARAALLAQVIVAATASTSQITPTNAPLKSLQKELKKVAHG